jgi:hypothetical protein
MKRTIKVTIDDFQKIAENLNDPGELALYEAANGQTYEAEIEHDGYAVVDLPDGQYIELAPAEYQIMIPDWKKAGEMDGLTVETKSDPADDKALLYRAVDAAGNEVRPPQSLPKELVKLLGDVWFAKRKGGLSE